MSKKQSTSVKTAEDFAFMCSLKRSLKSHPVFAGGGEGILVLVAPESHSPVRYGPALLDQLFPDDDFRRDDRGFMYLLKSDKLSKTLDTFRDECSKKRRAIVIVEHGAIIPAEIKVGADVITNIPPITPRDLQIACRIVLGIKVSSKEAKQAVSYPEQLLWSALRRGRSMSSVLERLTSAGPDQEGVVTHRPSREVPALEHMYGYGDAKAWGMQLAQDLEDWRNGVIDWDDVDRGIVLSGAPGVGKTIFAQAVAKQCGVKLIATSLGQWQSRGHLGDLLKAMRADFVSARAAVPSILFVDELDSIGDRQKFKHDNADYSIQVVNAFLEQLDGIGGREGVIVMGATNHYDRIDPAVVRAGRLERHVAIPLPDAADRLAILSQHVDFRIPADELERLVVPTQGMSGADLAQAARHARRIARRGKRNLTIEDVLEGLPEVVRLTDEHRYANAVHEAGHTLVGVTLGVGKYVGTRLVQQLSLGKGASSQAGAAYFEMPIIANRGRANYSDRIAMTMAGLAAEELIFGETFDGAGAGQSSDLARATWLATMMETSFGMGASYRHCVATDDDGLETLRRSDPDLRKHIDAKLADEFSRAKGILENERDVLLALAKELFDRCTLDPEKVAEILERSSRRKIRG
ncbi:AAA family ATPase [Agrobacterium sp. NPDC058088]|uniref:AAA family ATPase n=1 Tax=Agrobacterium sp. NPDC058088 TaxID=3346335 RepID=UPI0036D7A6B8